MIGKPTIAVLTGGGDVPGPNPALRSTTIPAVRGGHGGIGIRRRRVAETRGAG